MSEKENRERFITLFENIQKHFDDTAARDKLVIDYIDCGIRALVFHNITRNNNPTICELTSELSIYSLDDSYCFMIMVYGKHKKKKAAIIKKTKSYDEMIHDIKGFYNWD